MYWEGGMCQAFWTKIEKKLGSIGVNYAQEFYQINAKIPDLAFAEIIN